MSKTAPEIEAIAATIQLYFDGLYHSDVEKLRQAFHERACVVGMFQGNMAYMSLKDFLGIVSQTPPPADKGEKYDMRIVSLDVTGQAAVVKVADLYIGLQFTDYLTLAEIDGKWLIVHKSFHHD